MMFKALLTTLTASLAVRNAAAQAVFCHYLIGTVDPTTTHAQQDVENAVALGFDALAMNLGAPTADWAISTVEQLFQYAQGTNLGLFFSMDLGQDSSLDDFTSIVNQYLGNGAYYKGPTGQPFLSTYSSGGHSPSDFTSFLSGLSSDVYFVPDLDDSSGYYTDAPDWFTTWDDVVDGVYSWETAWPLGSSTPANTSTTQDVYVQTSATSADKTYMIGLSSLQYKHLSGNNYYRIGEVNLPQRMEEILAMDPLPDFVEVITWNDAGEAHYIGNLWAEGIPYEVARVDM